MLFEHCLLIISACSLFVTGTGEIFGRFVLFAVVAGGIEVK